MKTKLLQRPAPDQHPVQGGTRYNRIRCYMHTAHGAAVGKITRPYKEETQTGLKNKNKSKKITQKVLTHNTTGDIIKTQRQRNTNKAP
nr:MAG TPA: hypothetical protein [Bacteriophage sp.]